MIRSPGVRTRKYLRDKFESASAQVPQSTPLLTEQPRCVKSNITIIKKGSAPSMKSNTSSIARKKQLELEAAEARAKIALELIDKKLEADLAAVDMEEAQEQGNGSQSSGGIRKVEQWLEKTHTEIQGHSEIKEGNPPQATPIENPVVNELAHTLQSLMRQTASQHEERLLTRLAMPRDLPVFDGDCFEWLHFKCAYDESTRVCNFSDTENLWRLRRALKGRAREAVIDLLIGHTPPSNIIDTLHLLFGRPDIILHNLVAQLKKLPTLPTYYQTDLVKFSVKINNCVATVKALNQSDILRCTDLTSIIISKFPSTLISKWTEYAYKKLQNQDNSKLELLASFLKHETEMLCVVGIPQLSERNRLEEMNKPRSNRHNTIFTTITTNEQKICKFCKKSVHLLGECRLFRRALRKDRWRFIKMNRLCFSCLLQNHDKDACSAPVCDIEGCGLPHHRLLHWSRSSSPLVQRVEHTPARQNEETVEASTVAHITTRGAGTAILKIVQVKLYGPKGYVITHALLDDAASVSLISADLVDYLGFKCEQSSPTKFIDAFGLEAYHADAPIVRGKISDSQEECINDIKLRKCNLNLPIQDLSIVKILQCKHLLHVKDKVCNSRVIPQLLIGEDNYHLIAPLEILHGGKNDPYATRCSLGWCIHGYCGRTHSQVSNSIFYLSHTPETILSDDKNDLKILNDLIKNNFLFDAVGISTLCRDNKAHLRAIKILDETSRLIDKQWEVGLPFKNDNFVLPDSYPSAVSRLQVLLKKFKSDSTYKDMYSQEIKKLFEEGYARIIEDQELKCKQAWYLPHFGVLNPNKPGKLRLVYDAAARVSDISLNDLLLTGPDLYNSLFGIMLQFREGKFAFTGDIKDMFLRIKIRHEDHNYLRFLWHDGEKMITCCMQNLIFGATCSPFVAQYIKNKNALRFEDTHSQAVSVILHNHYMDDCLYTTDSESKAIELINQITEIHKNGGFEIRNWASNSKLVLDSLPTRALAQSAQLLKNGATNVTERTLGLMWYPVDDMFGFQINLSRIPYEILSGKEPPTKAKMLSIIMSVYDIHGFLSPFLIKSKIILQNVHRSGVDWRCRIHASDHIDWLTWLDELKQLVSLRIPRHYVSASGWTSCYTISPTENDNSMQRTEMHVFSDASIKAYAAVIYFRFIDTNGNVSVCLVTSKCRVTPLRPISVPRLELQAAMIAARLARTVQSEHKRIIINKRYFWTDSHTVLQWIRSDPRSFKPYVAYRLGEIDELSNINEWRYVPSSLNAADAATKLKSPPLKYDQMWFQGPDFLRQPESQWPKDMKKSKNTEEEDCEKRAVLMLSKSIVESGLPDENRFSSWLKLFRTTARILLFIKKCQCKQIELNVDLIMKAQQLLIKKSQADSFHAEIMCLKQNRPLPSDSRLHKLTPYLDEAGILRVEGRIDKVMGVNYTSTRPAILDGKHKISKLLVEHYHRKAIHGANELVVNELRQQFWIIKLRPTVRGVAARCLFCKYRRANPQPQRMANLPEARLQHHRRPFSCTGIDFFGPMEVTVGRRREKRYGVLFTCLTIRAVHIEIAENLTADSAIMALQRMIARRGAPSIIYSDNGTNFRGADRELRRSIEELNADRIIEDGLSRGIEWRFIPPGVPEMGGSWERMIRTVKRALKTVLKERAPHQETLYTLISEVEALVNSRPITHVSSDPFYPEALTPNHFLIGTSSNGPAVGSYHENDLCLRRKWRIAQRLTDLFWNRWLKEYLPTLLPRHKWNKEVSPLKVGDYVILCEQNVERGSWRHGVVSATHMGSDGRVRVVDVRTRTGLLRRPVTRVALLSSIDSSAE